MSTAYDYAGDPVFSAEFNAYGLGIESTLRQGPETPEPGTGLLVVAALAVMAARPWAKLSTRSTRIAHRAVHDPQSGCWRSGQQRELYRLTLLQPPAPPVERVFLASCTAADGPDPPKTHS